MNLDVEVGRHWDGEMLGCEVCNHRHARLRSYYVCVIIVSAPFIWVLLLESRDFSSVSLFLVRIILVSLSSHFWSLNWFSIVCSASRFWLDAVLSLQFSLCLVVNTLRTKDLSYLLLNLRSATQSLLMTVYWAKHDSSMCSSAADPVTPFCIWNISWHLACRKQAFHSTVLLSTALSLTVRVERRLLI